jgi:hypothetical protein
MTSSPPVARHRAPEGAEIRIATPQDLGRAGRHAEAEWARVAYEPGRDADPFDWLGFSVAG